MNALEENDGERALFEQEMREDTLRRLMGHESYDVRIDAETLRALVKQHNGALALLREIVNEHPENTALTRRARGFLKRVK